MLDFCPKQVYECIILRKYQRKSEPMLCGQYFETGALGCTMTGDAVTDLPRKLLTKKQIGENKIAEYEGRPPVHVGEKRVSQIRIDQQILNWKRVCAEYGIEVNPGVNTQVEITKRFNQRSDVLLRGHLDLFPAYMMVGDKRTLCIIDTKLTDDINGTYLNPAKGAKWAWGRPEDMDHTQAVMYYELVRNLDFDLNPKLRDIITPEMLHDIEANDFIFVYWVFDYGSDNLDYKPVVVTWTPAKRAELMETIRKTISTIEYYNENGWVPQPDFSRCKSCPVDDCPSKLSVQIV